MFRWTVLVNGGPIRFYPAATAVKQEVYAFEMQHRSPGGRTEINTHVFNTVSLRWRTLTPVVTGRSREEVMFKVVGQEGHTAVLIEYIVYIWGWGGPNGNELYAFDVDTHSWFKPRVSGTVPAERNHSACVLGKVMFVHGGWSPRRTPGHTNDIYTLDTTTMVWALINTRGPPPPASVCHSATIIGTKMFVFGGIGYGRQDNNNVRVFDTETDCWLNTPSAPLLSRGRGVQSAFTYNGELYIIGGENGEATLSDLWKFNPETFSWTKVEPKGKGPGPVYWKCCCLVGDRIVLFGGERQPNYLRILDVSPGLKTLCKLAVIRYDLEQSELPHDIRWELSSVNFVE